MNYIISNYFIVGFLLFLIGFIGIFITKKNIIIILMSIEIMLLSINFIFIIFSIYLDDIIGQIFAFFILTVAASEAAIGLALLIIFYRIRGIISINYINFLKG